MMEYTKKLVKKRLKYSSEQANIGWLFYKDYYYCDKEGKRQFYKHYFKEIDEKSQEKKKEFFTNKNDKITGNVLPQDPALFFRITGGEPATNSLTTQYPGMVLGTGNLHATGEEGEFKLGCTFDHTTGLPYLPAPSVKGLLRSAFPSSENKNLPDNYKNARRKYVLARLNMEENAAKTTTAEYLKACGIPEDKHNGFKDCYVDLLEKEIFEGLRLCYDEKTGEVAFKTLSVYERDIFHDAYLCQSDYTGGRILEKDFITPHKHPSGPQMDQFANPVPIQFLKIAPNVTIRFQFVLKTSALLCADKKNKLLMDILQDLGVGAKTNTGYGQFHNDQKSEDKASTNPAPPTTAAQKPAPEAVTKHISQIKKGDVVKATVTAHKTGKLVLQLDIDGYDVPLECTYRAMHLYPIGRSYDVTIENIEKSKKTMRKVQSVKLPAP
jgi:CRISPR-associated protein Cmr6